MDPEAQSIPQTLLVHDGELADLRGVLGGLGTPFVERRGPAMPQDVQAVWDLILATPRRMLGIELGPGSRTVRIVVCDMDSRTLRNSLRRAGIELMVRRPVHPAALRALILHSLYRGPEKRRARRVAVGAPIRFRAGWRQHPGILSDVSLGGCRLITTEPPKVGKLFRLQIPAEVGGGRSYTLRARALRSAAVEGQEPETVAIHAAFESLSARDHKNLDRMLKAYQGGPATCTVAKPNSSEDASNAASASATQPTPKADVDTGEAPQTEAVADRREEDRRALDRRVVALDDEADRVLMGRDISIGGMRVNPSPHLIVGQNIKLAMHLTRGTTPLVVSARVHRSDGERGVLLRFHEVSAEAGRALMGMMEALPVVEPGGENGDTGYVVSELLEVGAR